MFTNKTIDKRKYISPVIEVIVLDNEISLALDSQSDPDGDPTWTTYNDCNKADPFNTIVS